VSNVVTTGYSTYIQTHISIVCLSVFPAKTIYNYKYTVNAQPSFNRFLDYIFTNSIDTGIINMINVEYYGSFGHECRRLYAKLCRFSGRSGISEQK
jgi:hypothetical protein